MYCLPVRARLSFRGARQRVVAEEETTRFFKCDWVKGLNPVRMPVFHSSDMSATPPAARLSTLRVTDDFHERGDRTPAVLNAGQRDGAANGRATDSVHLREGGLPQSKSTKRPFCRRCDKAAVLCICHHVKTVVDNKTSIIILQHPEEKRHHLGSARIALLGLQRVKVIIVSEVDEPASHRMRGKIPGSKRSIAGRGGKKAQKMKEEFKSKKLLPKSQTVVTSHSELQFRSQHSPVLIAGEDSICESKHAPRADRQLIQCATVPPWIELHPDVGLLFPSEKAIDLWPAGLGLVTENSDSELAFDSHLKTTYTDDEGKRVPINSPSQLIVLDGTWNKAKRIFFENPWLHSLPHYRLPTLQESRYGRLRREPKAGFLSTVESIVCALQLLEPEIQGLESLLDVFDRMMNDQMQTLSDDIKGRYEAVDSTSVKTRDNLC